MQCYNHHPFASATHPMSSSSTTTTLVAAGSWLQRQQRLQSAALGLWLPLLWLAPLAAHSLALRLLAPPAPPPSLGKRVWMEECEIG